MEQVVIDFCPNTIIQGSTSSLFLTLINFLLASKCSFTPGNQYPPDYGQQLKDGEMFDFIVVGAGSAGSVVASRLSENFKWKVLLIESGSYPSADSEVPAIAYSLQKTIEDWQYHYEPSDHLLSKDRMVCPRGKGLGGSSLINYMFYFRGHRSDYDSWAEAGNDGWDYNSVAPLFKKFENLQEDVDNGFGRKGELKITQPKMTDPVTPSLFSAYKELGYNNDYSEDKPLGTLTSYSTIFQGRRYNTAKAFLGENVKNRQNLFIALNAQVSKLLIDSELTVKGVEIRLKDKLLKIYAGKEVILSAGSVNSPHILMNSGVGPEKHLKDVGIKVVKNLQVGQNLQDHIFFNSVFFKVDEAALTPISETSSVDSIYKYFMHGEGYLASVIPKLFGFINPRNNTKTPTLQIYHLLQPLNLLLLPFGNEVENMFMPDSIVKKIDIISKLNNTIALLIGLAYPKSRGQVLLRSSDPFDKPLIFTNYLSHKEDVANIIDGIRFAQKLIKTESLGAYNPELLQFDLGECHEFPFDTDKYWECMVRHFVRTIYHLVGTCKMGPASNPDAVVDSRLRVYGIKGVRVIDGSIMPKLVGVNTNGPIIMIGEKGAQMIKEDWAKKSA